MRVSLLISKDCEDVAVHGQADVCATNRPTFASIASCVHHVHSVTMVNWLYGYKVASTSHSTVPKMFAQCHGQRALFTMFVLTTL